ncbi:MAG: hypothetical protein IPO40_19285 [Fibrobacteres bacterium]|nr:hypothetical protein [Fibrobacterota bacterium]
MSMDLEARLLQRIEQENIRPYPRWIGWTVRVASTLSVLIALVFSTLAASVFFLWLFEGGDQGPHKGFRWVMIGLLPWLSLASALFLSWIGWKLFRRTGTGYRRRAWVVVMAFFAISFGTGFVMHVSGGLFSFHRTMAMASPVYREFFQGRRSLEWSKPEEGRLAGIVVGMDSVGLELRDPQGKLWKVAVPIPGWLETGMEIRLEGRTGSEHQFLAERVDRFGPGGRGGMGHGKRHSEEKKGCEP